MISDAPALFPGQSPQMTTPRYLASWIRAMCEGERKRSVNVRDNGGLIKRWRSDTIGGERGRIGSDRNANATP